LGDITRYFGSTDDFACAIPNRGDGQRLACVSTVWILSAVQAQGH
jgi:hypothetical protein